MTILESFSPLIGGEQINEFAPYVPSLNDARAKAVLFSASLELEGRHPYCELPRVKKEDVLHADDVYAHTLILEDAHGVTLAEEREHRLAIWEALGLDTAELCQQLGSTNRIKAISTPELVKPHLSLHLEQERRAARFVLAITRNSN